MRQIRRGRGGKRSYRSRSAAIKDRWSRPDFLVAMGYLCAASLFGGGLVEWSLSALALALATMFLTLFLAWRNGAADLRRVPPVGRIALIGIAILPLLQLVPLPPVVWQALPGQELRHATLNLVGIGDSWQPLSLEPISTAWTAILAVGFAAFVILLVRLNEADFFKLLYAMLALILLGMGIGLFQVIFNGQPVFYPPPQGNLLLGFFANKNHMALAIACGILLFDLVIRRGGVTPGRRLAVGGFTLIALVCIVTTNSRAGLGFGVLAAVIVLMNVARGIALRWRLLALTLAALVAVTIMSSSAFEIVSDRVGDATEDVRWQFTLWSLPLAKQYFMLGSGFGSFTTLFQTHEQLAWLRPTFVNAAHDDYLQLAIEAGIPGLAILLVLVCSIVGSALALQRMSRRDPRRREAIFGLIIATFFALHSFLDYPLRRPAAWIIFSVALACVYRTSRPSPETEALDGS